MNRYGAAKMSTFLDWESEEGSRPSRRPDEGTQAPKRSRRWLRWGAVLVILLLIVGLVACVFVTKRQSIIGEAEA